LGSILTVLKPRSRKVSVRLSEEEYVALRRVCSLTSARSVSDVTREAVRAVVKDVHREDQFGRHLDEFRADMKILERKVEELEAKIAMFKGESAP
jgi:Arc/MetJ-type ribon-helix-helix transcriptional regulator